MRRALVGLALLALPGTAAAFHDESPVTDYSTSTLEQWEVRLGLWRSGVGVWDTVEIGTVLPLFFAKSPNLDLKWQFYQTGKWSFSGLVGILTVDLGRFDKDLEGERLSAVPFTLTTTYQWRPDLRANLQLGFTKVQFSGQGKVQSDEQAVDVEGVAATSTGYAGATIEWRLGRVLALVLDTRVKLYQEASADGSQTTQLDPRTTLETFEDTDADLGEGFLGYTTLGAFWNWETFNLRAGLGYGNYMIPVANFFIPTRTVVPELDLYWRF